MSIQRKILNPELVKSKNYIRGTIAKKVALEELRSSNRIQDLDRISAWAYGWLSEIRQLNSLSPNAYDKIDLFNGLRPTTLNRELLWIFGAIKKEATRISKHLKYKEMYEKALLDSTLEEANDALDLHFSNVGPTLFYLSNKINLVQEIYGTEAQKSFTAKFQNSGVGEFSGFMSYWWSVRAQKEISFDYFNSLFQKNLKTIGVQRDVHSYFSYQMFGEIPNEEFEAAVLAYTASTTAVDLYEFFVSLSTVVIAENRNTRQQYEEIVGLICDIIADQRLYKLTVISGSEINLHKILTPPIPILEAALVGKLESSQVPIPSSLCELHLASPHIDASQLPNSIISEVSRCLSLLTSPTEKGRQANKNLRKLSYTLNNSNIGKWCGAISTLFAPGERPFKNELDGIRYVYSSDSILEACSIIGPEGKEGYHEFIKSNYVSVPLQDTVSNLLGEGDEIRFNDTNGSKLQEFLNLRHAYYYHSKEKLEKDVEARLKQKKSRTATYLKCWLGLENGNVESSLNFATSKLLKGSGFSNWLPMHELATAVYLDYENYFPHNINTSILYNFLNEERDNFSSIISFAAEDYIDSVGCSRPSELLIAEKDLRGIYFLSKVCTLETMRRFSEFQVLSDLENERISICRKLVDIDPLNRAIYEDEAQEIMTQRKINEAVEHLHASKISIDEDALSLWAESNINADFRRFLELRDSGQIIIDEDLKEALFLSFETGKADRSLFEIPKNESAELLVSIVNKFITQCFVDQEHGLNCYLSIEIRHGALEGTLRSAPEKEGIITRRIKELDDYEPNIRWQKIAVDNLVPSTEWEFIEDILKVYAKKYDTLLSEFTDSFIQIRTEELPDGLFDPRVTPIVILSLASDIEENPTFEQLVSSLFEVFWTMLDNSLTKVREHINVDLSRHLDTLYEKLEKDIRQNRHLPTLADAIVTAKNENQRLLKQVHDWFELPSKSVSHSFDMEGYLRIALETVKGFHPEFNPNVEIKDDNPTVILGGLKILPKVFFEIFQNIFGHCGTLFPNIKVLIESDDREIKIRTVNSVDPSADKDLISTRISASRHALSTSAYRAQISREGGTGFPKLARLIGFDSNKKNLKFDLDTEKNEFWVEVVLETRTFQGQENEPR